MKKTPAAMPRIHAILPVVACGAFLMAPAAWAKFPFTVGEIDKTQSGFCTFHDANNQSNLVTVTPEMSSPDSAQGSAPVITMTGTNGTLTIMLSENTVNFVPVTSSPTDKPTPTWGQPTNAQITIANAFIAACNQTQPNQPDLTVPPDALNARPPVTPSQNTPTNP